MSTARSKNSDDELKTTLLPCGHEVLDALQCHYCDYIQDELIEQLMVPKDASKKERSFSHPDEFQFILVHQSCELSFKGYLYELKRAVTAIEQDHLEAAAELVERCRSWILIAARQLQHLVDHLTPQNFAYFRDLLSPASGAESIRFRLIEITTGLKPESPYVSHRGQMYTFRQFLDRGPALGVGRPKTRWWTASMTEAADHSTLRSALADAAVRHNYLQLKVSDEGEEATRAFGDLLKSDSALQKLAVALIRLERGILAVRKVHLNAAKRHIAEDSGTGHTAGVAYLRAVMETARCFPALTVAAERLEREEEG